MQAFVDQHPEILTGEKYIAPRKRDIHSGLKLEKIQNGVSETDKTIVEIAVEKESNGASSFTAFGTNRGKIFEDIMLILRHPTDPLYRKIIP